MTIGNTSRQNHDLRQDLQTSKNDLESLNGIIKSKERELQECNSDIGFLRGELKRHGYNPKIPGRQSTSADPESRRYSRPPSDIDDVFEDPKQEIEQKMKAKEIRGQARATPLLLAEGRDGIETALRRRSSFKSAHQSSLDRDGARSSFRDRDSRARGDDENRLIDDLNERIRRLQDSLEKERRNNDSLMRRYFWGKYVRLSHVSDTKNLVMPLLHVMHWTEACARVLPRP